ncbi:MAG: flavoprotein [Waddliaceae bacterium]
MKQQLSEVGILIGVTGSIGMLNVPVYLEYFRSFFSEIKVIMTESAKQFIPEEALSLIAGPTYSKLFPLSSTPREYCHVQLARWADVFIILPATANILALAAYGMSHSLLSSTILCYEKPIFFFPNMNQCMWEHPATRRNVSLLEDYGHHVIPPKRQMGFEYASGEVKEILSMPPADEVLELIKEEIHQRSNEDILEDNWLNR